MVYIISIYEKVFFCHFLMHKLQNGIRMVLRVRMYWILYHCTSLHLNCHPSQSLIMHLNYHPSQSLIMHFMHLIAPHCTSLHLTAPHAPHCTSVFCFFWVQTSKNVLLLSVALLSQAKKYECDMVQPSSWIAWFNVLNKRYVRTTTRNHIVSQLDA